MKVTGKLVESDSIITQVADQRRPGEGILVTVSGQEITAESCPMPPKREAGRCSRPLERENSWDGSRHLAPLHPPE